MVALLAFVLLVGSPPTSGRIAFADAIAKIEDGDSPEKVERLLGKPDEVRDVEESATTDSWDGVWCYGSDGPESLPVMGQVHFGDGHVSWKSSVDAELARRLQAEVSETKVAAFFRDVYRPNVSRSQGDPQRLIQAANELQPLGKKAAFDLMQAYEEIVGGHHAIGQEWLFWLIRVLFEPTNPPGYFRVPRMGGPYVKPPTDPFQFPTYPILLKDDVPFCVWKGAFLRGGAEGLADYIKAEGSHWRMRDTDLRPPDDPFLLVARLLNDPNWIAAAGGGQTYDPGWKAEAAAQVLALVKTAYSPPGTPANEGNRRVEDSDRYHQEYLALKPHWDPGRQMYVRGDGTGGFPVPKAYPKGYYKFKGIPRLSFKINWYRDDDETIRYGSLIYESAGEPMPCAKFLVVDEEGHEVFHLALAALQGTRADGTHDPMTGGQGMGGGFECRGATVIRFLIEFRGQTYSSPLIKT